MEDNNYAVNMTTSTPGLAIHGSSSALVKIGTTFGFKANGRFSPAVSSADCPSLALATLLTPSSTGTGAGGSLSIVGNQLVVGGVAGTVAGNLAFDNGTVPVTTGSCRFYTLCADLAQTEAGTVSLYWLAGADFPKHRQGQASDIPHTPLSTSCEVGYVYVKNETAAVFVPGTTALDTSSLTVSYSNNYGYVGA